MPRRRVALFAVVTLALPFVCLLLLEGLLRLVSPDPSRPLFVAAPVPPTITGSYLVANAHVAERYFPSEQSPPAPQPEAFAATKPRRGYRVFVLGESSTAAFPYPRNATFSRLLRDVLRDVLPHDSVEVVNLGIAATNSYTLLDIVDDVAAQRPDAVLIYAGHNEYYGALGVGSSTGFAAASSGLVRAYLQLIHLRTVTLLRDGLIRARRAMSGSAAARDTAPTFMEVLARDQRIELAGPRYAAGLGQFERNLTRVTRTLRRRGVKVLVASLASNIRDQPPFSAAANDAPGRAVETFAAAHRALRRGDSAAARALFVRARDLDVVRFRAPSEFNAVIRRVAAREGATYVPAAEAFDSASPGAMPGHELFLEHVHPNVRGQALLARTFVDALRRADALPDDADYRRLRSWDAYVQGMDLTPFDERIAQHTIGTLLVRWPFVAPARQRDYRATYRPNGMADSLALLVSRGGIAWAAAKVQLGADYERRGAADSAVAEYRGLIRDMPFAELPLRLEGRALMAAGQVPEAERAFEAAMRIEPTASSALALGTLAVQRHDLRRGIALLREATQLDPTNRAAWYQLSLAYGLDQNIDEARATAVRVFRLDPTYPGLAGWMMTIGLGKPVAPPR